MEGVQTVDPADKEALREICNANGLQAETLWRSARNVVYLEMFMHNFPEMRCLHHFPALRELNISQQSITRIQNIAQCNRLERLWLHENRIKDIKGLEELKELRELYLHSNRISRIEGLEHNHNLRILWLCNNMIVDVENLGHLENLRELNLAQNSIERVGESLQNNVGLEHLNLAANSLGTFKEIAYVARLPNLRTVCFDDPHWGPSPLASLANYQSYALYMMPQLEKLDHVRLRSEAKATAESMYMKKKMFYNMRMKTLKREVSSSVKLATEGREECERRINKTLSALEFQLKWVERELEEHERGIRSPQLSEDDVKELRKKHESLSQAVMGKREESRKAEEQFDAGRHEVQNNCDNQISWLHVELENGGNIRLEECRPASKAFQFCQAHMRENFAPWDLQDYGVTGVKIRRVLKVHNRFLQARFRDAVEEHQEKMPSSSESSEKWMLLGKLSSDDKEIYQIAEEGIRLPKVGSSGKIEGGARVAKEVASADLPRLADAYKRKDEKAFHSTMLIVKVLLGRCIDSKAQVDTLENIQWTNAQRQHADTILSTSKRHTDQQVIFVMQPAHLSPQYLVEFKYEEMLVPSAPRLPGFKLNQTENLCEAAMKELSYDVRAIMRPMGPFLAVATRSGSTEIGKEYHEEDNISECPEFNMPPALPERPTVYLMNKDTLKKCLGNKVLSHCTYLNLHGNQIRKVESLEEMTELRILKISFNRLTRIEGLNNLSKLEHLDLSYNLIERIEGLKGNQALTHLNLSHNRLHRMEDINLLKKCTPSLAVLDVRGNPMRENRSLSGVILRRLGNLVELDGCRVTKSDREQAAKNSSMLTMEMIKENASTTCHIVSTLVPSQARDDGDSLDWQKVYGQQWLSGVQRLVVDHKQIRHIQNLGSVPNLRQASFNDNELTRVDGLEACGGLEHVSLEGNRIGNLDGIKNLYRLHKLDLGKNCIVRCNAFSRLTRLTQLSIEDNYIASFAGLSNLVSLMELYASNNQVEDLKELKELKSLERLAILDLEGNPLCEEEDYRHYALYHLPRIKILDGHCVDATEQAVARNKYAGRLTREMIKEKAQCETLEEIKNLDLSNLRIRELAGSVQASELNQVTELNLDNNLLSNVCELSALESLSVLRLNHNRIESGSLLQSQGKSEEEKSSGLSAHLKVLQLGGNLISSISSLSLGTFRNLRSLFLHDNEICRVDGLEYLSHLQELVLDKNKIKQLEPSSLRGLHNLLELRIESNSLKSLTNIEPASSLRSLFVGSNRLIEMSEFERLSRLENLLELRLHPNPLTKKQNYRLHALLNCPSLLVIDGEEVTEDELEQSESLGGGRGDGNNTRPSSPAAGGTTNVSGIGQPTGGKVPIKLTNMNFEFLGPSQQNQHPNTHLQSHQEPPFMAGGKPDSGRSRRNSLSSFYRMNF